MPTPIKPGDRFSRWTVLSKAAGWAKWHVRCDCGTERVAHSGHLFGGSTKSCGCLRDELVSKRARTHGRHNSPEYKTWRSMLGRCINPRDKDFAHYGGAGVSVCERWRDSFEAFFGDMGERPSAAHSIERRDNAKGYSRDNCCWATRKQQAENRRTNQHVMLGGERMTVAEAARRLGYHRSTIRDVAISRGVTRQEVVDSYAARQGARIADLLAEIEAHEP